MGLTDDLLNDDLYADDDLQSPQSTPQDENGQNPVANNNRALNENGRRARSNSDLDPEEEARMNRRSFMETSMDLFNITGPNRDLGRQFADLDSSQQIMHLFSFHLVQRSQIDNVAAIEFLRSEIYNTHVVNRIKVALLAPWLTNYVTLLQDWMLTNILQSKEAWRIESAVTDVAEQWQHFSSEFKTKTTQLRSQNKQTMIRLRDASTDINEITKKLAPKGMVIREHHRARLAWIMLLTVEFDKHCDDGKEKSGSFWDWIGSELIALKTNIATNPQYTTDLERRTAMTKVFTRALTKHRDTYPPKARAPTSQSRPAWQETLEEAMDLGTAI